MTLYGERDGAVRPVLQIAMPRLPRIYAPGGTMHVVARCNNRESNSAYSLIRKSMIGIPGG